MTETLKACIEEMLKEIDEFAKCDVTPGTPLYTFQQDMIKHAKRYRISKLKTEQKSLLYDWDKVKPENRPRFDEIMEELMWLEEGVRKEDL